MSLDDLFLSGNVSPWDNRDSALYIPKYRVLVVDDDSMMLALLKNRIKKAADIIGISNIEIMVMGNPDDVLSFVDHRNKEQRPFHVSFIDDQMPIAGVGKGLVSILTREYPLMKNVLMSGAESTEKYKDAIKHGFDFIAKDLISTDSEGSVLTSLLRGYFNFHLEKAYSYSLGVAVDSIEDIIFSANRSGKIIGCNDAISSFSYNPGDIIGKRLKEVLNQLHYKSDEPMAWDYEDINHIMQSSSEKGDTYDCFVFDKEGNKRFLRLYVKKEGSQITFNYNVTNDYLMDPLTVIPNRRFFDISFDKLKVSAKRYKQSLGILYVDIDHFKNYNDTYGHSEGDTCLRLVAQAMAKAVRASDVVCRLGGEEFGVICPNTSEGLISVAHKLHEAVAGIRLKNGSPLMNGDRPLTISVGGAYSDGFFDKLVETADRQLYDAKNYGRNSTFIDNIRYSNRLQIS